MKIGSLWYMCLVLMVASCKSSPEEKPGDDTSADATLEDSTGQDTAVPRDTLEPDLTRVEFGLETRPSNTTCLAPQRPPSGASIQLERVFEGLSFTQPIWMQQAPGEAGFFYVVEQPGRVIRFANDTGVTQSSVALDITGRVEDGGERGLLGLAFHPDFQNNGQLFLSYTGRDGGLESRISRFTTSDGGATFDASSEAILFRYPQPAGNHNGGQIAFGPDGRLYIALGDGGGSGDQYGHGQNTDTPLGAILRIDVDAGSPYAIPDDNPFANGGGAAEIFAWGLRNPWRFSFDRATGALWAGDVGQNAFEEIDKVEIGGNYGWPIREGTHCYPVDDDSCSTAGLIDPVVDYPQSGNGRSITGGYVYNGSEIAGFVGTYLFGDFTSGVIWRIVYDETTGAASSERLLETGLNIASFAQDLDGELYVISYDGRMFKIIPDTPQGPDTFPKLLSETGCVDPAAPTQMASGVIPYALNVPFWSDGAEKSRYFAIPDGETIGVNAEGDWELPVGSVVIKEFRLNGRLFETRLMVHHDDGWAGYTYVWRDDGSDAELLEGGLVKEVEGQSWTYPSRVECLSCHTSAAGYTLGLETGQLHRDAVYPGNVEAPQLATLEHIGMLSAPIVDATAYPTVDGDAPLDDRARAYLHSNCSQCHRTGGPTPTPLDMRFATALADSRLCDEGQAGDMGIGAGARIVEPGVPGSSLLSNRMRRRDAFAMPPLGSHLVDSEGAAVVDAWIESLTTCP